MLRQEDHGIDLHCSLTERKGKRAWPLAYFSVQVKSTRRPVTYSSRDSVEWLVGYPAPLLLCVVDKKAAQISIYQTMHRFVSRPPRPNCRTRSRSRWAVQAKAAHWTGTTPASAGSDHRSFSS